MTIDYCIQLCIDEGRLYAGLKDSTRCNCGINYALYGWLPERECDQPCGGDSSQICGGYDSNSVYETSAIPSYPSVGEKVGIENSELEDSQFSCSSVYDSTKNEVTNCRLNSDSDGWAPSYDDNDKWLQVDLKETKRITGVMTQGSGISTNRKWVYTFKVGFSNSGSNWTFPQIPLNDSYTDKVFTGHDEYTQDTAITHVLDDVIETRYVRFYPLTCEWSCNMRVEILVIAALGMNSGTIADECVTASSVYGDDAVLYGPSNARLNLTIGAGYWRPMVNRTDQFLQIDLRGRTVVSQLAVQGGEGNVTGNVERYKVAYMYEQSGDENWVTESNGHVKIFDGISNDTAVATSKFDEPVFARIIRIYPLTWSDYIALRVEVYGYIEAMTSCAEWYLAGYDNEMSYWLDPDGDDGANPYPTYCEGSYYPLGMTTGYITDDYITQSDPNDNDDYSGAVGRLYYEDPLSNVETPAWVPDSSDQDDWLEIMFRYYAIVRMISTQGRDGLDEWVKKYFIKYKTFEETEWTDYEENSERKIFDGNTDAYTAVQHILQTPIWMVTNLRFYPKSWEVQIAMKVEVYGEYINHPGNNNKIISLS
ncbi:lactadherin-like [Glandiceps talaboti]